MMGTVWEHPLPFVPVQPAPQAPLIRPYASCRSPKYAAVNFASRGSWVRVPSSPPSSPPLLIWP